MSEQLSQTATSKKTSKVFPWLYTGLVLLGFSLGVLVTTTVDMFSRSINTEDESPEDTEEVELCRSQGGRYDLDKNKCLTSSEDEGTGCKSNDDCEGWCLASNEAQIGAQSTGECSKEYRVKGCVKFIDNGSVNEVCLPE